MDVKKISVTDKHPVHDGRFMPICQALRPLLLGMTLAGLYHDQCAAPCNTVNTEKNVLKRNFRQRLPRYYHLLITALIIGNAVRYVPSFWVGPAHETQLTVPRIFIVAWLIQCAVTGIIMFWACDKSDHLQEFISKYNLTMTDDTAKCIGLRTGCTKLNFYAKLAVSVGMTLVISNVVASVILCFLDDTDGFRTSMVNPLDHNNLPSTVFVLVFFLFESCAWILPVFFFIGISSTVCLQFKTLYKTFEENLNGDQQSERLEVMVCLKHIRRKHHQLCQAVEVLDRSFKYIIANYFGINVFLTMFIAYHLITSATSNILTLALHIFWLTAAGVVILVISIYSTNVTYWAHAPLDLLYDLQLNDMAPHQLGDLNLFLSRLTASPIGFTVMGLFTVTKEMILTLGGIILTYFFILLQFRID